MADKTPTIKFGHATVITPINVKDINKRIAESRKFQDERLKRLRKQMFRTDI